MFFINKNSNTFQKIIEVDNFNVDKQLYIQKLLEMILYHHMISKHQYLLLIILTNIQIILLKVEIVQIYVFLIL